MDHCRQFCRGPGVGYAAHLPRNKSVRRGVFLWFLSLVTLFYPFLSFVPVAEASSDWSQTDWSGGSGQTSWSDSTKYSSESGVDTSTVGQVTLSKNERLSNTGFEADLTSWSSSTQTLNLQPDATAGKDTTLEQAQGGIYNYGTTPNMWTGHRTTWGGIQRIVIQFDLSSIPTSATVTSATLSLYLNTNINGDVNGITVDAYRFRRAWLEGTKDASMYSDGANWNTYDSINNWGAPGATDSATDIDATAIGSTTLAVSATTGQFYDWSLTPSAVQGWVDGSFTNNGLLLKGEVESENMKAFSSSDNTTASQHPKMSVDYTFGERSTAHVYSGSGSVLLAPGSNGNGTFTESVNVGDTNSYNLSAYAYTDGSAVTSSDVGLYYNGSAVSTTYTSVGSGWYKLTGTVTGVASSVGAGVQVLSGKTVYLDDVSLYEYGNSGSLTSSIFDTGYSAGAVWGTLTYNATTPTNTSLSVKVRTSNNSDMSGATAFSSCSAITSGSDISSDNCVTDQNRYIQYQESEADTDLVSTPTFQDITIAYTPYDNTPPTISITNISDPTADSTPTLTGTATDTQGTVSSVQFQVDSTSGSWSSCDPTDGSFDSASEGFSCTTTALSDGSHTIYVRAEDNASNISGNSADSFTVDTTQPTAVSITGPDDLGYINSERPLFRWKAATDATSSISKYALEIDNPSIGSGELSGDFTIDNIPASRTTDYETGRYLIHYENFGDSDATNNYISVYTKSSNNWSSSENDGKLREGRVNWRVKASDSAGNEIASARVVFVDRTVPSIGELSVGGESGTSNISVTLRRPEIKGKITDPLSGGDPSQSQDENGPRVASGPNKVQVKVEKKKDDSYSLDTIYTANISELYYSCDSTLVSDNTKQSCDKYGTFSYTPDEDMSFGEYRVTISGEDKAGNWSADKVIILDIGSGISISSTNTNPEVMSIPTPAPVQETKTGPIIASESAFGKATQGDENVVGSVVGGIGQALKNVFSGIGNIAKGSMAIVGKAFKNVATSLPGGMKGFIGAAGTGARTDISKTAFYLGQKVGNVSEGLGYAIVEFGYLFVNEPTTINNVKVAKLGSTSATITWMTNHPANGKVNYGLTPDFGLDVQSELRVTKHVFVLTNLKPGTTYYYEVMSHNKNYVYDANHTFITPQN